jgi:hypothetical protein
VKYIGSKMLRSKIDMGSGFVTWPISEKLKWMECFPRHRAIWVAIGNAVCIESQVHVDDFPLPKRAWWSMRRFWRYVTNYHELEVLY